MNGPYYPTRDKKLYRLPIAICVVAAVLILGILLISGGSDDPVVQSIAPPVQAVDKGTASADPGAPSIQGAIDGKGVEPYTEENKSEGTGLHDDHGLEPPETEAIAAGPAVDTAVRFAELNINRPADPAAAIGLNKKLVEFSAGSLATELSNNNSEVATAQVESVGEVFKAIPVTREGRYAEVLIVSREAITDAGTGVQLDPKYLTYLVRLEQLPGGRYAVTSWEPQI